MVDLSNCFGCTLLNEKEFMTCEIWEVGMPEAENCPCSKCLIKPICESGCRELYKFRRELGFIDIEYKDDLL